MRHVDDDQRFGERYVYWRAGFLSWLHGDDLRRLDERWFCGPERRDRDSDNLGRLFQWRGRWPVRQRGEGVSAWLYIWPGHGRALRRFAGCAVELCRRRRYASLGG